MSGLLPDVGLVVCQRKADPRLQPAHVLHEPEQKDLLLPEERPGKRLPHGGNADPRRVVCYRRDILNQAGGDLELGHLLQARDHRGDLAEDPGKVALAVPVDGPAGGVRRCVRVADQLQCFRVHVGEVH